MARQAGTIDSLAAGTVIFARSGEYWTIGYSPSHFSLKDIKGLSYIQRLLQHPGDEFHALDLLNGPGVAQAQDAKLGSSSTDTSLSIGRLGDAGEMLDGKAKQDYKRRLAELQQELEDAREFGNSNMAEQILSEIDFLTREISRAVGLDGRDRRAGSAAERARLNVTRAIRAAIGKITEYNSALGQILSRTIVTGVFCSYVPDSRAPVTFSFTLAPATLTGSADVVPAALMSPAPAPILALPAFEQILAGRTAFVGRERESAALVRILDGVCQGVGRVVMLSGPAGVGKSRIATEFCAKAMRDGIFAVSGVCDERQDAPAFLPFLEVLESALAQAPTPSAFRNLLGDDAAEIARLMPALRRTFPDIPVPREVPPEESRQILLAALVGVITRAAQIRPVILLLEDLHWADAESLSVLYGIAKSFSRSRIMILGTFRDHEIDGATPLARLLDHLTRLHLLDQISLSSLSETASSGMVDELAGCRVAPGVTRFIYSSTEGNPLFIEELFRHLVERGELILESGDFTSGFNPATAELPRSLRLVIERRLAALSTETRKVLGTAAVIGRSFNFDLLENVTDAEPELVLDSLEEAEKAGLIFSTLDQREASFQFSHILIRQVVLAGLLTPRRQRIHLRVAAAILVLKGFYVPELGEIYQFLARAAR